MRSALVAVALGLAIGAGIVACGAGAKKEAMAPPRAVGGGLPGGGGSTAPRDEITQLDQEIAAKLGQLKLPEPAIMPGAQSDVRTIPQVKSVCVAPSAPTGTCGDVCTLSSRICEAADRICVLAQDLAPDPWAAERCDKGKKSCEAATRRCCQCS